MPTVVRSGSGVNNATSNDFLFSFGTALTEGNLGIALITRDTSEDFSAPAGWTQIQYLKGPLLAAGVYYKIAGASEPTSYTWTSADTNKWAGGFVEISGFSVASPINSSSINSGTSVSPVSSTITTTADNCMVIAGFGHDDLVTRTLDAALTTQWNQSTSGGNACGTSGGTVAKSTAGATGNYTHTSSASEYWIAFNVAVAPQSGSAQINAGHFRNHIGGM